MLQVLYRTIEHTDKRTSGLVYTFIASQTDLGFAPSPFYTGREGGGEGGGSSCVST